MRQLFCIFLFVFLVVKGHGQELLKPRLPDTLSKPVAEINTQPPSDIDIPIQIALKPVYEWANGLVDTLYTSPNYPTDWVLNGCDTRYQYRFVRAPFQFKALNNVLYVAFSGYYGVRGSTRLCTGIGNSVWTPTCTCGFGTEKPRRIDAGFTIQFQLLPDYRLGVIVKNMNPQSVDKCTVCFFGKDITNMVAGTLKTELENSVKIMQQQLQTFSLKPYLQNVWDTLQAAYRMPGFGYLATQPEQLRISQATLRNDSLFISLGLTARPELKQTVEINRKPLPNITDFKSRSGFKLFIVQNLPYDSLCGLINSQIAGKDFQIGKGLFKKTVRIDSVKLLSSLSSQVLLKVFLSKAAKGVVYLQGKPMWSEEKQEVWLDSLDFHLESKQLLLRTASSLLDGTITAKLKGLSHFNFKDKVTALNKSLFAQMNRNIYSGVTSKGFLTRLAVSELKASNKGLYIAAAAEGKLWIDVDAGQLLGKFLAK